MESSGNSRRRNASIVCSASTSALVAKSPPPLSSFWSVEPKRCRTTEAPTAAAVTATSTSRFEDMGRVLDGASEEVAAPTQVLRAFVGFSLDVLDDGKPRNAQRRDDVGRSVKP